MDREFQDLIVQFAEREITPLVSLHEKVFSLDEVAPVISKMYEIGLLNTDPNEGLGPWQCHNDYLQAIAILAESSSSVSFQFHQLSLGQLMAKSLKKLEESNYMVALQGNAPIDKVPLYELLQGQQLSSPKKDNLREYFSNDHDCFLLQAIAPGDQVMVPQFNEEKCQINWVIGNKKNIEWEECGPQHGLNEAKIWKGQFNKNVEVISADTMAYVQVAGINALACLSMALGSVKRGLKISLSYSEERKQGGSFINHHSTVATRIARANASILGVSKMLHSFESMPQSADDLRDIFQIRSLCHPLLTEAANECLQILGGYGYMKDFGLEKIVRENNHLQMSYGTPTELQMF
jgi:acyl-CoA dehydrogenase